MPEIGILFELNEGASRLLRPRAKTLEILLRLACQLDLDAG